MTWTTHSRPQRSKTRLRSSPRRDALTPRPTRRSRAHCERLEDRVAILDTPEEVDDIGLLTQVETVPVPKEESRGRAVPSGRRRARRPQGRRAAANAIRPRLHERLLPVDHRPRPDRRRPRQRAAVGPHGRDLGSNRRQPRRPQGPCQRDRQRCAQPHQQADARRAGRAQRRRRQLPAPLCALGNSCLGRAHARRRRQASGAISTSGDSST